MKLMVWGEGSEDSVCMTNKMGLRPQMLRACMSNMNNERSEGKRRERGRMRCAAGGSRVASGFEISLKRAHVAAANRFHALQV
jgi:hypothetical protein